MCGGAENFFLGLAKAIICGGKARRWDAIYTYIMEVICGKVERRSALRNTTSNKNNIRSGRRRRHAGLRILCIAGVLAILSVFTVLPVAFAAAGATETTPDSAPIGNSGTLKLTDSTPRDGFTHMTATNVAVKLYFDGNVTEENVLASNKDCFKLTDSKDKVIPTKAVVGDKRNDYILLTAHPKGKTGALENNSTYKLTISKSLHDVNNRSLGEDVVINFKTVDVSLNSKIYMGIMGLMVAAMIGMTVLQNRRKQRLEAEVAAGVRGEKINPYKYAREKGITVDQALAHIEKEKQKRAKRLGVTAEELDKKIEEAKRKPTTPGAKRVHGPRPISAGGSSYKTGRKAEAEARKRAAAAKRAQGTTNPKNKNKKGKPKR
jgi:hypothetical protein